MYIRSIGFFYLGFHGYNQRDPLNWVSFNYRGWGAGPRGKTKGDQEQWIFAETPRLGEEGDNICGGQPRHRGDV